MGLPKRRGTIAAEFASVVPGQCGANSAEPSSGGGGRVAAGAGTGSAGGAGAGSGGGGGGSGAGGGGAGGGGLGAAGAAAGPSLPPRAGCLESAFTAPAPRVGWVCGFGPGLVRRPGFGVRGRDLGTGAGSASIASRGSPTSAATGGGSGGVNSPGSSRRASRATTATRAALPAADHRTRTPRMRCQAPGAREFSPYAVSARSCSMSCNWSSTQSPGLRE